MPGLLPGACWGPGPSPVPPHCLGEGRARCWGLGDRRGWEGLRLWSLGPCEPTGEGRGGALGDTGVEGAELLGLYPALQPSLSPVSSPGNDSDSCEMKRVCDGLRVGPEGAQAWNCSVASWVSERRRELCLPGRWQCGVTQAGD